MADSITPAVSTAPASTTVVAAAPTTPTLAPAATTEQPIQNPVAANEAANTASNGLNQVVQGRTPQFISDTSRLYALDVVGCPGVLPLGTIIRISASDLFGASDNTD